MAKRRGVKPASWSYLEAEAVLRRSTKYLLEVDTRIQLMVVKGNKLDQVLYGLERMHNEMMHCYMCTYVRTYIQYTHILKITAASFALSNKSSLSSVRQ